MNRALIMKRKKRRRLISRMVKTILLAIVLAVIYYLLWVPYQSSIFEPPVSGHSDSGNNYQKSTPVKKQNHPLVAKKPTGEPGLLLLVNKDHLLPADYEVSQVLLSDGSKYVSDIILNPLENMLADGRQEGLRFLVVSGYRTISYQDHLIQKKMRTLISRQGISEEQAYKEATRSIMPSRSSEHCSGLAVDITSAYYTQLDEGQENTPEYKWLVENCWKYGFILRYPPGREEITGIVYEPWHYRYVGSPEVAKYIMDNDLTLEEYLEQ